MGSAKQFSNAVSFIKAVKTALELVGWWSPLVAIAGAFVWAAWAMIWGLSFPVIVLGTICLAVAVAYLALLPRFLRLLARNHISEKPNYHMGTSNNTPN